MASRRSPTPGRSVVMNEDRIAWTNAKTRRFWSKVAVATADECWQWTGSKNYKGYGAIRVDGQLYMAHRIAWSLERGTIASGMIVCHHCDRPNCVNPRHLFIGTYADNTRDMYEKGREFIPQYHELGEAHCGSKLTEDRVRSIRSSHPAKTMQSLADYHCVSIATIHAVIHRRTWRHI